MSRARPADPRTIAARSGVDTDTAHGAVMPPLYLSSNYSFAGFDQKRKYDYSRSGNPTRDDQIVFLIRHDREDRVDSVVD